MAYGTTTALVAGTATLLRPSNANWMFVLNADITPLLVTFKNGSTTLGQVTLSAATSQDAPGGYIDSIGFPIFLDGDSVVLTSSTTTGHFNSGVSTKIPVNSYSTSPSY